MLAHPTRQQGHNMNTWIPCPHGAYMSWERLTIRIPYLASWETLSKYPNPKGLQTFILLNGNMTPSGKFHTRPHVAGPSQNACALKILFKNTFKLHVQEHVKLE